MKISTQSISMLIIGLVLGFVLAFILPVKMLVDYSVPTLNEDNGTIYESSGGEFSFSHPEAVEVNCNEDLGQTHCILISPTEVNPQPIPDMTVTVSSTGVQMSTWEGLEISYFEDLVSSFTLTGRKK